VRVLPVLEFWPDYKSGPLWSSDGRTVDLSSLGLPDDLIERLHGWNARYADDKLPFGSNDIEWLREGEALLGEVRAALSGTHTVVVTESWWGEEPDA
jgi:hypothetical protein